MAVYPNDEGLKIDKSLLLKMLTRGNELSLSKKTMGKYEIEAKRHDDNDDPNTFGSKFIIQLQKKMKNEHLKTSVF